jgi:hypothetical protein
MVGTINHLADQGEEGRLEGGMISAPIIHLLSSLCSPSPPGYFTMFTSWCAHLPLPHHNQICPMKLTGPHKLSCCPFTSTTLDVLLGSWRWDIFLVQNIRNKIPINTVQHPGRAKTSTTPWSKPQISISNSYTSKCNVY